MERQKSEYRDWEEYKTVMKQLEVELSDFGEMSETDLKKISESKEKCPKCSTGDVSVNCGHFYGHPLPVHTFYLICSNNCGWKSYIRNEDLFLVDKEKLHSEEYKNLRRTLEKALVYSKGKIIDEIVTGVRSNEKCNTCQENMNVTSIGGYTDLMRRAEIRYRCPNCKNEKSIVYRD